MTAAENGTVLVRLSEEDMARIKERIEKAIGDTAARLKAVEWNTPTSDALQAAFGAYEHRVEHARHFIREYIDEGQRNRRERRTRKAARV
jgi:class 3 adenylate cyclase